MSLFATIVARAVAGEVLGSCGLAEVLTGARGNERPRPAAQRMAEVDILLAAPETATAVEEVAPRMLLVDAGQIERPVEEEGMRM